jgi:hypothetical protein
MLSENKAFFILHIPADDGIKITSLQRQYLFEIGIGCGSAV